MQEIIDELEALENLTVDRSFGLARLCSSLLKSNDEMARKIIINILNNWPKIPPATKELWVDLMESAGFYPYIVSKTEQGIINNFSAELRLGLHESNNLKSKFFHEEQYQLLSILNSGKNVIVSAPTSFGKSLLIEEIIASRKFKNVVVIQPTLALLEETRKKLLKYSDNYKLVVRTSQEPDSERANIFLFTAERVNEYNRFPPIDFLVIDEFYKLSGRRDDERSSALNSAFYYLLNRFSPRFYLLGPNIDSVSEGFVDQYNAVFFKSDYTLVDSRTIDIYANHKGEFGDRGKKKIFKESVLFDLLLKLKDEQTIIYCSSPERVRYLAKEFCYYLNVKEQPKTSFTFFLSEWIKNNVSPEWCVLEFLDYRVGIHDGALQKHITTTVIDYFNEGFLSYLFCTSTIIEGVNTSAKNIICFDKKRGGNDIDFFDYSNIRGRAGRMMEHFVGRVYNFNEPPINTPTIIDIPFFQQNPIKDEVLIQIDDKDVKNKETNQYASIQELSPGERDIIKRNGVSVSGQRSLISLLRAGVERDYFLIDWIFPDYRQLEYILGLAWDHLIVEGETTRPMTKNKLINRTFNYGLHKDINSLVQESFTYNRNLSNKINVPDKEIMDSSIQEVFQIMKHWFEYKVPKWLSVMNEIVRFICLEKGIRAPNYSFYANLIENDFLRPNLSILAEYGIPSSAIRKIESSIPDNLHEDFILNYIRNNSLYNLPSLLDYEKEKIKQNLL